VSAAATADPLCDETGSRPPLYAPAFKLASDGSDLAPEITGDVTEIVYVDAIDEVDGFEVTLGNWNLDLQCGKYMGPRDDLASNKKYADAFVPGRKLELHLGYERKTPLMVSGEIVSVEPHFPGAGAATVRVRALNPIHRMRSKQHSWRWEKVKDSDLARELGGQKPSEDRPGLGVEVRVDSQAASREPEEPFLMMENQYDVVFLLERARRRGYCLALREDDDGRHLWFGPDPTVDPSPLTLEWGKSLVDFAATLSTVEVVPKLTVRGWNRRTREPIVESASWGDAGADANADHKSALGKALDGRHEVVTDYPVHTPEQARELARGLLAGQLHQLLHAHGSTVGLPRLRAGRAFTLKGFGKRLSGLYLATGTTHRFTAAEGYHTSFCARRLKEDGS
jgi:phage protein D